MNKMWGMIRIYIHVTGINGWILQLLRELPTLMWSECALGNSLSFILAGSDYIITA